MSGISRGPRRSRDGEDAREGSGDDPLVWRRGVTAEGDGQRPGGRVAPLADQLLRWRGQSPQGAGNPLVD